ncbi:MAG: biotin synthase BioB [Fusobacteriota bacterium]
MNKEIYKYIDEDITKEEALKLFSLKGSDLTTLFDVANRVREKYCGNKIHYCTITNAKSGNCSEDCKFCAQSAHHETKVNEYGFRDVVDLEEDYIKAKEYKSENFGIVTSGKGIKSGTKDFEKLKEIIRKADSDCEICGSIGLLTEEEAKELKEAGLIKYHNNLQTSKSRYSDLVSTTHSIEDRIESIKNAKKAGLKICSGGIIGMGESHKDRVDMAFELKDLDVDGVPINILNPIKGTVHGDKKVLDINDILKTIAIFRLILKDKTIKLGAGRETILKDFTGTAFLSGANGMLVGGYLTVKGRSVEEDMKFIEELKKLWE